MLSQEEKQELLNKLKEKKAVIQDLRSKLNELNDKKEKFFEEKDKVSKEIRSNISHLKGAKDVRDKLTGTVQTNKKSRDELNQDIKKKIDELKLLEAQKEDIVKKHNIQGNPVQLKKMIEEIEFRYETSVMSFDNEKKVMAQIKALKKQYEESNKVSTVWKQINQLSKEIETLKRDANLFHRQMQTQANQSQEKHEELIESSKMIKDLKKKEKDALDNFLKYKTEFNEYNDKLKKELTEINELYGKLDMNREEVKEVKRERQKRTLDEKRRDAEEKMKSGKKLTTEDILALQSGFSDDDDLD